MEFESSGSPRFYVLTLAGTETVAPVEQKNYGGARGGGIFDQRLGGMAIRGSKRK